MRAYLLVYDARACIYIGRKTVEHVALSHEELYGCVSSLIWSSDIAARANGEIVTRRDDAT